MLSLRYQKRRSSLSIAVSVLQLTTVHSINGLTCFEKFHMPPTEKTGYCGVENISRVHPKNGSVYFSAMSRNSSRKMILIESSSGKKVELGFIPPT
ncbi:hypothetical protein TNCV_3448501 [Trichonephila clavipes]|nr:hypothetical protein TNCV_3448501 [Trichonephila clavipes]